MPKVNNFLLIGVVLLCLIFRSSEGLASAYGISVTGTMISTSGLAFFYLLKVKKTPLFSALMVFVPLFFIEFVFLASNMLKLFDGGFVPVIIAGVTILLILTWLKGSKYLMGRSAYESQPVATFAERLQNGDYIPLKGTGVFLTSDPEHAPAQFLQNLKFNKVLHEHNIILNVRTADVPKVNPEQRYTITKLNEKLTIVVIGFGFMETPNIPAALHKAREFGLDIELENICYYLGRRKIISDPKRGLPGWQDNIFIWLVNMSSNATDFYKIPHNRVFEISLQMVI